MNRFSGHIAASVVKMPIEPISLCKACPGVERTGEGMQTVQAYMSSDVGCIEMHSTDSDRSIAAFVVLLDPRNQVFIKRTVNVEIRFPIPIAAGG